MLVPLIFTFFVTSLAKLSKVKEDDGIYFLNDNNYDDFIAENDHILVFLYSYPCLLCKQIIPELKKTVEMLLQLPKPIKIATLNCTESPNISKRLQIDSKIQMKFVLNGKPINYTGGRSSDDIVIWVKKLLGPSIGEIKSISELETLKQMVKTLIVFFGENDNLFRIFHETAREFAHYTFVKCSSNECLDNHDANDGHVILFKKYDEGKNEFKQNGYTLEDLINFVNESARPMVMNFDIRTAQYIFDNKHSGIFLYRDKNNDTQTNLESLFNQLAPIYKGKLQFIITDITDVVENKLASLIGVKSSDLPIIMIHDTSDTLTKSYKMNGVINEDNVLRFINDWENNKHNLTRYIKTKEVPTNQTDSTFMLVGSNLESYVNDPDKDVIVFFYAPWCKHCKEFLTVFENVAKKLQNSTNLRMAKFDAHHNEATNAYIQYYPTVLLWTASNKNNYIEFKEERTEEQLIKFLKRHCTFPL